MDFKVFFLKSENKSEAFNKVQEKITPDYIAKFKVKADIFCDKKNDCITGRGKGFTLTMNFFDDSVTVALKLSLLLRPFKTSILETIEKKLKRTV